MEERRKKRGKKRLSRSNKRRKEGKKRLEKRGNKRGVRVIMK